MASSRHSLVLAAHPRPIGRPAVIAGVGAVLGRPPAHVEALL